MKRIGYGLLMAAAGTVFAVMIWLVFVFNSDLIPDPILFLVGGEFLVGGAILGSILGFIIGFFGFFGVGEG